MSLFRAVLTIVVLSSAPFDLSHAALPEWSLEIERVRFTGGTVEAISVGSASDDSGTSIVKLRAEVVRPGDETPPLGPFTLSCAGPLPAALASTCDDGLWSVGLPESWSLPKLEGRLQALEINDAGTRVSANGSLGGLSWQADLELAGEALEIALELPQQAIQSLAFLEPRVSAASWVSGGTLSGSARYATTPAGAPEVIADVKIAGLDFDSPDGVFAGLGVDVGISARSVPSDPEMKLQATLSSGELLLQDFYRDFSDAGIEASGSLIVGEQAYQLRRFAIDDGESLYLAGEATIPAPGQTGEPQVMLRQLKLTFPLAYTRYLESVAAVYSLDGMETAGSLSWNGDWMPGAARSGELRLDDLRLVDAKSGRFAIVGLQGTLRTGVESRLTWSAASFEKLDLGGGSAHIELTSDSVRLRQPLRVPVFGGTFSLEALSVSLPGEGETDVQLQAALDGIEMRQMSAALGWPEFGGTLSGRIPGISLSGGVIGIDGVLEFDVFDGEIELSGLKIERPFGVLPSLAANITATNLDLEQVTQTFEFGRIAGRIDGYVHDLRMLDWEPVQFDAWFGTPEDAGRQGISRRAVRHLTTIGGGSPTAILSGPVLRLFNDFSYRRLGLGCTLRDNVCQIRGIEQQGDAVLLMEGAGIPKISILAYNRAVDWPQLAAELGALSSGEEIRIGD